MRSVSYVVPAHNAETTPAPSIHCGIALERSGSEIIVETARPIRYESADPPTIQATQKSSQFLTRTWKRVEEGVVLSRASLGVYRRRSPIRLSVETATAN
jgi:hypothetical protein